MGEMFMSWLAAQPGLGTLFSRHGGGAMQGVGAILAFVLVAALVWIVAWRVLLSLFGLASGVVRFILFLLALGLGGTAGAVVLALLRQGG